MICILRTSIFSIVVQERYQIKCYIARPDSSPPFTCVSEGISYKGGREL